MSQFTILITQPPGFIHSRCFVEVAQAVAHSLRQLGHEVVEPTVDGEFVDNPEIVGRPIVFGANLLPLGVPAPDNAILFNLEPIQGEGMRADNWKKSHFVELAKKHVVLDYSRQNVERLKALGALDVRHCPIGYSPALERIQPVAVEDIDVLHYGALTPGNRRMAILDALDAAEVSDGAGGKRRLRVEQVYGKYGAERDALIARAKIVLCVHYFKPEDSVWEVVRCSYPIMNGKCVVSESGGMDPEMESLGYAVTASMPYSQIVETCRALIEDDMLRAGQAATCKEQFKRGDQTVFLKRAMEGLL